jgi:hypothetical protein
MVKRDLVSFIEVNGSFRHSREPSQTSNEAIIGLTSKFFAQQKHKAQDKRQLQQLKMISPKAPKPFLQNIIAITP